VLCFLKIIAEDDRKAVLHKCTEIILWLDANIDAVGNEACEIKQKELDVMVNKPSSIIGVLCPPGVSPQSGFSRARRPSDGNREAQPSKKPKSG